VGLEDLFHVPVIPVRIKGLVDRPALCFDTDFSEEHFFYQKDDD
jgi:hypothetical protein